MEVVQIEPLRAFSDNYIWLLHSAGQAVVVDPGDAAPVLEHLARERLRLTAILVTHHHDDHSGGIAELLTHQRVPVFGPAGEAIEGVDHSVQGGERFFLPGLDAELEVLDVAGHTRGHVAYYGPKLVDGGALFCGDTLFACGCGRIFEGTAAQMWQSLARLAALPAATRVYCAHEYTVANLRFARAVEPNNAAIAAREREAAAIRARDEPTLPSTIGYELATNPFLRWSAPEVVAAAQSRGATGATPIEVFAAIREWKNRF